MLEIEADVHERRSGMATELEKLDVRVHRARNHVVGSEDVEDSAAWLHRIAQRRRSAPSRPIVLRL